MIAKSFFNNNMQLLLTMFKIYNSAKYIHIVKLDPQSENGRISGRILSQDWLESVHEVRTKLNCLVN